MSLKDLTPYEKDKYMSCSELVSMKSQQDAKKINDLLTQEPYLKQGIKQMIGLDMMLNCVKNIDNELVNMMYKDLDRVVNIEGVREERIAFIKVNYDDYKDLKEFIFNDEQRNMLKIATELREEQRQRMNKKVEANKKKKIIKEEEKKKGDHREL